MKEFPFKVGDTIVQHTDEEDGDALCVDESVWSTIYNIRRWPNEPDMYDVTFTADNNTAWAEMHIDDWIRLWRKVK